MRFLQQSITVAVAITVMVAGAGVIRAQAHAGNAVSMFAPASHNYNGAWPVTVTGSKFSNGTGCLTLTGNARGGAASLVFGGQQFYVGQFLVINRILVATIQEPLNGSNGSLMFTAPASHGHIGPGVFENVEGGEQYDAGKLMFGIKNGC
jgi:hypothetical protein